MLARIKTTLASVRRHFVAAPFPNLIANLFCPMRGTQNFFLLDSIYAHQLRSIRSAPYKRCGHALVRDSSQCRSRQLRQLRSCLHGYAWTDCQLPVFKDRSGNFRARALSSYCYGPGFRRTCQQLSNSQLRLMKLRLRIPYGAAEHFRDFLVFIALDFMQQENGSVSVRQLLDGMS